MEKTVMQAIQIEAFGNPAEVMKVVDVPDVGAPAEGEVVIALEASPINMSDLLMISGRYGYRPKLPSVMGTEGVGRVLPVGGDVVLVDGPDLAKRVAAETGKAAIALAVDGVGDTSTTNLLGCLAEKGVHVFYSTISGKPSVVSATHFIFRDISMRGFWLANWFNRARPDQITEMYDRLTPLVASRAIRAPIAGTYPC